MYTGLRRQIGAANRTAGLRLPPSDTHTTLTPGCWLALYRQAVPAPRLRCWRPWSTGGRGCVRRGGRCDRLSCPVSGEGERPGTRLRDVQQQRLLRVGHDDRPGLAGVLLRPGEDEVDGRLAVVLDD